MTCRTGISRGVANDQASFPVVAFRARFACRELPVRFIGFIDCADEQYCAVRVPPGFERGEKPAGACIPGDLKQKHRNLRGPRCLGCLGVLAADLGSKACDDKIEKPPVPASPVCWSDGQRVVPGEAGDNHMTVWRTDKKRAHRGGKKTVRIYEEVRR